MSGTLLIQIGLIIKQIKISTNLLHPRHLGTILIFAIHK